MSATEVGALVLVAAAIAVLGHLHVAAQRAAARERARLFDAVAHLVEDPRLTDDAGGYPTLTGRIDGHRVTLRPVVDALTLRKLPVLWLEITLHRPVAVDASLDVLLRPHGTEFFSPNAGFAHEIGLPDDFPRPARLATPEPARAPSPSVLDPALALLHAPVTKELGVGRGGVRLVRLLAEGDQASYRVSRRAVFDRPRVAPEDLTVPIEALVAVAERAASTPTAAPTRGRS